MVIRGNAGGRPMSVTPNLAPTSTTTTTFTEKPDPKSGNRNGGLSYTPRKTDGVKWSGVISKRTSSGLRKCVTFTRPKMDSVTDAASRLKSIFSVASPPPRISKKSSSAVLPKEAGPSLKFDPSTVSSYSKKITSSTAGYGATGSASLAPGRQQLHEMLNIHMPDASKSTAETSIAESEVKTVPIAPKAEKSRAKVKASAKEQKSARDKISTKIASEPRPQNRPATKVPFKRSEAAVEPQNDQSQRSSEQNDAEKTTASSPSRTAFKRANARRLGKSEAVKWLSGLTSRTKSFSKRADGSPPINELSNISKVTQKVLNKNKSKIALAGQQLRNVHGYRRHFARHPYVQRVESSLQDAAQRLDNHKVLDSDLQKLKDDYDSYVEDNNKYEAPSGLNPSDPDVKNKMIANDILIKLNIAIRNMPMDKLFIADGVSVSDRLQSTKKLGDTLFKEADEGADVPKRNPYDKIKSAFTTLNSGINRVLDLDDYGYNKIELDAIAEVATQDQEKVNKLIGAISSDVLKEFKGKVASNFDGKQTKTAADFKKNIAGAEDFGDITEYANKLLAEVCSEIKQMGAKTSDDLNTSQQVQARLESLGKEQLGGSESAQLTNAKEKFQIVELLEKVTSQVNSEITSRLSASKQGKSSFLNRVRHSVHGASRLTKRELTPSRMPKTLATKAVYFVTHPFRAGGKACIGLTVGLALSTRNTGAQLAKLPGFYDQIKAENDAMKDQGQKVGYDIVNGPLTQTASEGLRVLGRYVGDIGGNLFDFGRLLTATVALAPVGGALIALSAVPFAFGVGSEALGNIPKTLRKARVSRLTKDHILSSADMLLGKQSNVKDISKKQREAFSSEDAVNHVCNAINTARSALFNDLKTIERKISLIETKVELANNPGDFKRPSIDNLPAEVETLQEAASELLGKLAVLEETIKNVGSDFKALRDMRGETTTAGLSLAAGAVRIAVGQNFSGAAGSALTGDLEAGRLAAFNGVPYEQLVDGQAIRENFEGALNSGEAATIPYIVAEQATARIADGLVIPGESNNNEAVEDTRDFTKPFKASIPNYTGKNQVRGLLERLFDDGLNQKSSQNLNNIRFSLAFNRTIVTGKKLEVSELAVGIANLGAKVEAAVEAQSPTSSTSSSV